MKKDAAKPGSASGLSVAGWPLRRKLALALAIPLLLAATLGGLRVQGDLAESRDSATTAKQVTVLPPAIDYLNSAELAMVAAQSTSASSQGDLIDAIADIESAAGTLTEAADAAELNDRQAEQVEALLDLSQSLRGSTADDLGPATWVAQVRQLESSVSQLISSITAAQSTPEPRLEQLSQALSGRMSLAMQQALVANAELSESSSQELFSEIGVEASAIDRLASALGESEPAVAALRTANTVHAGNVAQGAADDMGGRDAFVPYDELTTNLLDGVEASLNETASDSRRAALVGALLTLLALAAAIALAFLIAKSLLGPISRVREGALAVARHRLPDAVTAIRAGQEPEPIKPIDVSTNEEIGQLARAVDDLHRQAIHLASGEAQLRQTVNAMFVTLSRRSNSLVNQQLAQIERLEQDEEDPKRLESLFRLDHLASRMRRTADSLLILADSPNRSAGQFSLTVGESLQAATSGVQDYQRVQIHSQLGTRIDEDSSADVVHLLTELVDNALSYSPPSEPVRLNAELGADGVTVTITDSGLGVPDAELAQLNADLGGGVEATPDTARRMGLFVVSRLAQRHGITAKLTKNARGSGMTATVLLPPAILPEVPDTAPAPAKAPAEAEVVTRKPSDREDLGVTVDAKAVAAEPTPAASAPVAPPAPEPAAAAPAAQAPAEAGPTPDRPPLMDGLLPRREPGANMPRTGADAFLPPETSAASGPLFGKRDKPAVTEDAPASVAERVAAVVPITALAARQRAQAEEEAARAAAAATAEEPVVEEPVAEEPVADEPVAEESAVDDSVADELVAEDPVADDAVADDPVAHDVVAAAPVDEDEVADDVVAEEPVAEEPVAEDATSAAEPLDDPLTAPWQDPEAPVVAQAEPEPEPQVVVEPEAAVEPEVAPEPEPSSAPAAALGGAALGATARNGSGPNGSGPNGSGLAGSGLTGSGLGGSGLGGLAGGLPTRTRGAAPEINRDMPGLPSSDGLTAAAPARTGGDSPIFKSMRSGWLAGDGEGEWHETEIDKGWEIAEHVAEEKPVAESTSVGLPVRQPGERLVPGSVTAPTQARTRDPEAIRRRLSAHAAGVSRGRRAANSSSQHTEAGPA